MQYNFDEVVERRGTYSMKWDMMPMMSAMMNGKFRFDEQTIPLQVADMDFPAAQPIVDAMHRVADFRIYGYTSDLAAPAYRAAIVHWFKTRHNWEINPEHILYANGTVEALNGAIRAFSKEGEGIILCRPVYGHFTSAIEEDCRRKVVSSQLINQEGYYSMNFADIEAKCADPRNKCFVLCSPHNPVGRVWQPEELRTLAAICKKHQVILISDEVHCDILRKGVRHYPLAAVVDDLSNIVVLNAVNKTFNLAGLSCSNAIIADDTLRAAYHKAMGMRMPTPFAVAALIAAYTEGEEWLDQVNAYIDGNIDAVQAFLQERMPKVKLWRPEGTYCLWLDFSGYGLSHAEIEDRIYGKANVMLQSGLVHDPQFGAGFERVCLPAARSVIMTAFERIAQQFADD
ncbi:MAG: PatB family C-S lyase [Negativicutes bacterium]|nr:PatB family C-S lyase [Negativicutes bacterium]